MVASKTTKTRTNRSYSSATKSSKKATSSVDRSKKVAIGGVIAAGVVAGGVRIATLNTPNSSIMDGIKIAEAANIDFDRDEYFTSWDVAGEECDLRSQLLEENSLTKVNFSSNGCTVIFGKWKDPYTGEVVSGNPAGGETEDDFDIDHVIPLSYVSSHGGSEWSDKKKREYGASLEGKTNNLYVEVLASENRSKGDKGISEYYPPNEDFECKYAWLWHDIAIEYSISLSRADYEKVEDVLNQPKCAK